MVRNFYQQEHNIECHDWKELEGFKPIVEKTTESMSLFRKGKGKEKGMGGKQRAGENYDISLTNI